MKLKLALFSVLSAVFTFAFPALHAQYVYTANEGANNVSAYKLDTRDGTLTVLASSPYSVPPGPAHITSDPLGRFVYVSSLFGGQISGFAIDKRDGTLTPIPGSPFSADPTSPITGAISPETLDVDPSGRFLYVANSARHNIAGFTINQSTGALSSVPNSPFALNANALGLAVDPTGRFLYASGFNVNSSNFAGTLSAFSINPRDGSLKPVPGSPFACGSIPNTVTIDPFLRTVYVVSQASGSSNGTSSATGTVDAFRINFRDGSLTPLHGLPVATGSQPASMAIDLTGRFAYVVNNASSNVSAYHIDLLTGALKPLPGSPFATGLRPYAISMEPGGERAFVTSSAPSEVQSYKINFFTGALEEVFGSPVSAGSTPQSITVTRRPGFFF